MTSKGIGGEFDKADLVKLPVSEKTTWGKWKKRYPKTRVLSVDGTEHVQNNPYDNYFSSEKTFRDMKVEDDRLSAKASIFAFWIADRAVAVPHSAFIGGKVLESMTLFGERRLLISRPSGASVFESSQAFLIPAGAEIPSSDPASLVPAPGEALPAGFEAIPGFDTFWYNWVSVHPDTFLLEQ